MLSIRCYADGIAPYECDALFRFGGRFLPSYRSFEQGRIHCRGQEDAEVYPYPGFYTRC